MFLEKQVVGLDDLSTKDNAEEGVGSGFKKFYFLKFERKLYEI
jgi:hypothetical protein